MPEDTDRRSEVIASLRDRREQLENEPLNAEDDIITSFQEGRDDAFEWAISRLAAETTIGQLTIMLDSREGVLKDIQTYTTSESTEAYLAGQLAAIETIVEIVKGVDTETDPDTDS